MARPFKKRRIRCNPSAYYFKPRGIPMNELQEIILKPDELEALRLADLMEYSHDKSAVQMKISRATFGRIVASARYKIADALLNGKAVRVAEKLLINKRG